MTVVTDREEEEGDVAVVIDREEEVSVTVVTAGGGSRERGEDVKHVYIYGETFLSLSPSERMGGV